MAILSSIAALVTPASARAEDADQTSASSSHFAEPAVGPLVDDPAYDPAPWAVAGPNDATSASRAHRVDTANSLALAGLITFGLSYVPAVVVGGESAVPADARLFIPLFGPWLDLRDRPACGPTSLSCDPEWMNRAILVADGVFQGIAVIQLIAGLAMEGPTPSATGATGSAAAAAPRAARIQVSPMQFGAAGYGVAISGVL